jgi:hypothetical protein
MFNLDQQAKILSIATHSETAGEDRKAVYRMVMRAQCQSTDLIEFSSTLRGHFFKQADNPDLAEQGSDDDMTALRYPQIKRLKWDYECEGYHLSLDYGLGEKSAIRLNEVKIDRFVFVPQNGGTVEITFRITYHPDVKDVGKIGELLMKEIGVKLTPPEASTVQELFEKAA